jgi:hypothetical protein
MHKVQDLQKAILQQEKDLQGLTGEAKEVCKSSLSITTPKLCQRHEGPEMHTLQAVFDGLHRTASDSVSDSHCHYL